MNRRALSTASAAREAIASTSASSCGVYRRSERDHANVIAPSISPRATSGVATAERGSRLRRIPRGRIVLLELVERRLLVRVARGDDDAAYLRSLDDVDDAPVGEMADGEPPDRRKRRVVVQRGGERRSRLGEEL